MKFTSGILVICILILSIVPALPATISLLNSEKTCCLAKTHTNSSSHTEKHDKNCCHNACNPFMSCCNCYAMIEQYQSMSSPILHFIQTYSPLQQNFHSNFLSNAWNPPKWFANFFNSTIS